MPFPPILLVMFSGSLRCLSESPLEGFSIGRSHRTSDEIRWHYRMDENGERKKTTLVASSSVLLYQSIARSPGIRHVINGFPLVILYRL